MPDRPAAAAAVVDAVGLAAAEPEFAVVVAVYFAAVFVVAAAAVERPGWLKWRVEVPLRPGCDTDSWAPELLSGPEQCILVVGSCVDYTP